MDNTLIHSRIDFAAIRSRIISALVEAGALTSAPSDPRSRSIPEWLAVAEHHDAELASALWTAVDEYEREGMLTGSVESDVEPALGQMRSLGFRLALLTNNSAPTAHAALERFRLSHCFHLVLARGLVEELKPGGAGVAAAHHRLGGGTTYVVGDAYIDGLAAQRARVGARFVAFRAKPEELEQRGVEVWRHAHSFAELPSLLSTS